MPTWVFVLIGVAVAALVAWAWHGTRVDVGGLNALPLVTDPGRPHPRKELGIIDPRLPPCHIFLGYRLGRRHIQP